MLAFILFILGVATVALSIPKIWRTSPDDFTPEVKVSLLDMVQAKSLARTARAKQATGEHAEAALTWRTAVANNRADLDLLRGMLRNELERDDDRPKGDLSILNYAHWTMRLSSTNDIDLDLVLGLYERNGFHDLTVAMFRDREPESPTQKRLLTKARFFRNDPDGFLAGLSNWPELRKDPEIRLIVNAIDAASLGEESRSAREALVQASEDPAWREQALRLRMRVDRRRFDVEGYIGLLGELEATGDDNLADHTGLWDLLIESGRRGEAVQRVINHTAPPANRRELLTLLGFYDRLNLDEPLEGFLERHADFFRQAPGLWFAYAELLIRRAAWDELEGLARRMRHADQRSAEVPTYADFIEALADASRGRLAQARDGFRKVAGQPLDPPAFAMFVARRALLFGFADSAMSILDLVKESLADEPDFWRLQLIVARDLNDTAAMMAATEALHRFDPENPAHAGNLAALRLIARTELSSALTLTHKALQAWPDSHPLMINHALALLLNHRIDEARAELERIGQLALTPTERAARDLVAAEFHSVLGEQDRAADLLSRIDKSLLSPYQIELAERLAAQTDETPTPGN